MSFHTAPMIAMPGAELERILSAQAPASPRRLTGRIPRPRPSHSEICQTIFRVWSFLSSTKLTSQSIPPSACEGAPPTG